MRRFLGNLGSQSPHHHGSNNNNSSGTIHGSRKSSSSSTASSSLSSDLYTAERTHSATESTSYPQSLNSSPTLTPVPQPLAKPSATASSSTPNLASMSAQGHRPSNGTAHDRNFPGTFPTKEGQPLPMPMPLPPAVVPSKNGFEEHLKSRVGPTAQPIAFPLNPGRLGSNPSPEDPRVHALPSLSPGSTQCWLSSSSGGRTSQSPDGSPGNMSKPVSPNPGLSAAISRSVPTLSKHIPSRNGGTRVAGGAILSSSGGGSDSGPSSSSSLRGGSRWQSPGAQPLPSPPKHPMPLPPPPEPSTLMGGKQEGQVAGEEGQASEGSPGVPNKAPRMGNWKKYEPPLGSGSFGVVYKGFNRENGSLFAVKEVALSGGHYLQEESLRQIKQELLLLSRLSHPNIVQYQGTDMDDRNLYIFLEYMPGGSIHRLLEECGKFPDSLVRTYTRHIVSGLSYLHQMKTVHRDIKGANLLVDTNGQVKLADFGMAKSLKFGDYSKSFNKGSSFWMAPEILVQSDIGYDLAVDIWSLGCTVLEMASGKPPWWPLEGIQAMFKLASSEEIPPLPDDLSPDGRAFVLQCLRRVPAERPTAAQLLDHPFIRNAPDTAQSGADTASFRRKSQQANVVFKGKSRAVDDGEISNRMNRGFVPPSSPFRSPPHSPKPLARQHFSDGGRVLQGLNLSVPESYAEIRGPKGKSQLRSGTPPYRTIQNVYKLNEV